MKTYRSEQLLKNGQRVVFRTPRLGDEDALIRQMKRVDQETKFLAREADEFSFTLEQERVFIEHSLKDENRLFLVAEVGDDIVGNCSVGLLSSNRRYLHRASMGIAVCKAYWHQGIGKKLMQSCIDWCREKGIEQLELEVVTDNARAFAMYESFGFHIYGTKKHAMKYSDGTYADEYHMILFMNSEMSCD